MEEIKAKDQISDVEDKMYTTLEMCYEFYLRGFTFGKMNLYESAATAFLMDEAHGQLIPPFTSVPGLGEAAAESIVEQRKDGNLSPLRNWRTPVPRSPRPTLNS